MIKNNFIKVPINVLEDKRLSPNTKLLYGILLSLNSNKEYSFATNKYLSNSLNISKRSITNMISDLKKIEYISIKYSDGKRYIMIKSYHD